MTAGTDQSPVDLDKLAASFAEYGDEVVSKVKSQLGALIAIKDRERTEAVQALEQQAAQRAVDPSPDAIFVLSEARAKAAEVIPALADNEDFQEIADLIISRKLHEEPRLQLPGATPVEQARHVFLAAARMLGFDVEAPGERVSATRPQGAAGRGAVDVSARASRPSAVKADPKSEAVARAVRLHTQRMQAAAG